MPCTSQEGRPVPSMRGSHCQEDAEYCWGHEEKTLQDVSLFLTFCFILIILLKIYCLSLLFVTAKIFLLSVYFPLSVLPPRPAGCVIPIAQVSSGLLCWPSSQLLIYSWGRPGRPEGQAEQSCCVSDGEWEDRPQGKQQSRQLDAH